MTHKQRKARARAERKKRQRLERQAQNRKARKRKRAEDFGNKKFAQVQRSLGDLLPPEATFQQSPDGTVKIDMPAKRGQEDAAAADIARRLNIDPNELEVETDESDKDLVEYSVVYH